MDTWRNEEKVFNEEKDGEHGEMRNIEEKMQNNVIK